MLELSPLQLAPMPVVGLILFVLIILFYLFGYRMRIRAIRRNPNEAGFDLTAINGMLLGLLGLLLAFAFSMANSRFDKRRDLVVEEANNIGTTILRTDIFPDSMRQVLRSSLKEYVEHRIAFYEAGMDLPRVVTHFYKADSIGGKVWSIVANYSKVDKTTVLTSQIIPALNAMIDITVTRRAAGEATIPDSIMYFLFTLCLGAAFLMGYGNKGGLDWIIIVGLAFMITMTVYTIMDLDRPRSGLIDMDVANQKIVDLRKMFF